MSSEGDEHDSYGRKGRASDSEDRLGDGREVRHLAQLTEHQDKDIRNTTRLTRIIHTR